ncbi:hypothetical protein JOB18_006146 [Solea senegalensis]|uniref:Uncharacterized protein n=1 Tax=Solea senegalensis TaxID=28829 RepID=A0AAV6Q6K9_SOLSE|nr:hypothetical protein JOB18_006146 [Solea senegalensis]
MLLPRVCHSAARIRFKTLVLAFHATNGSGPAYIQDMIKTYTPARPLRSASTNWLAAPLTERIAEALRTRDCSLSSLPNGGTTSPSTSGQLKASTSSDAD